MWNPARQLELLWSKSSGHPIVARVRERSTLSPEQWAGMSKTLHDVQCWAKGRKHYHDGYRVKNRYNRQTLNAHAPPPNGTYPRSGHGIPLQQPLWRAGGREDGRCFQKQNQPNTRSDEEQETRICGWTLSLPVSIYCFDASIWSIQSTVDCCSWLVVHQNRTLPGTCTSRIHSPTHPSSTNTFIYLSTEGSNSTMVSTCNL